MDELEVTYVCTADAFKPAPWDEVMWLDVVRDFALLAAFHARNPDGGPFTDESALNWRDSGFSDAGIVQDGVLVARAARWAYSDEAWELAGVITLPERRGEGLGRSACSFITESIVTAGRTATCHTGKS
ncbi:MAG: FR47-like protein, partial [Actinomycetota bacterium]